MTLPNPSESCQILERIRDARVVICCGSGGVGKTCLSAVMGIHGALSDRKTLVLTIDPAKRLADALGLDPENHQIHTIPAASLQKAGLDPTGQLDAMIPDTRRTFDRLIHRYVRSASLADRILRNRYYQHISATLAGTHEYMAMEKLYEMVTETDYDLIVMDTPPAINAIDFLNAPQRLENLLGNNIFRTLLKPYIGAGKMGLKLFTMFTSPVLKLMDKLFGTRVMNDLLDFFRLGSDMFFDGFRDRAAKVKEVISSPDTLFFIISDPMDRPMQQAMEFHRILKSNNMPVAGFIINRVHLTLPSIPKSLEDRLRVEMGTDLAEKVVANYGAWQQLGTDDQLAIQQLISILGPHTPVIRIPYFHEDIYDVPGLATLYQWVVQSADIA